MCIIEDTRNKVGKHELKHACWRESGVQVFRSKLAVGDYSRPPARAVDTKENMLEIAQNIGGGKGEHKRFIDELKLARDMGTKLFVLVENEDGIEDLEGVRGWYNPRTEYNQNCIQGDRLAKAMATIEARYGCTFLFCRPEDAAEMIEDLLR